MRSFARSASLHCHVINPYPKLSHASSPPLPHPLPPHSPMLHRLPFLSFFSSLHMSLPTRSGSCAYRFQSCTRMHRCVNRVNHSLPLASPSVGSPIAWAFGYLFCAPPSQVGCARSLFTPTCVLTHAHAHTNSLQAVHIGQLQELEMILGRFPDLLAAATALPWAGWAAVREQTHADNAMGCVRCRHTATSPRFLAPSQSLPQSLARVQTRASE